MTESDTQRRRYRAAGAQAPDREFCGVSMKSRIDGAWTGWRGDTIVRLVNGSVWHQEQYYYRYQYEYRPAVVVEGNQMLVDGMPKAVRVRRIG